MKHEKFNYKSIDEIAKKADDLYVSIPMSQDTQNLFERLDKCGMTFENRFVIQPMEGCDAAENGAPGLLTKRRYERFAQSGAAVIWFEAVAVQKAARAKPNQLYITDKNLKEYKALVDVIKETSIKNGGSEVKVIMQAAHSGRYSNPNGYPEPIIAYNNPLFEKENPIDAKRIITDEELEKLEEDFEKAAKLAEAAGFDGVDIKCCHRYLGSELLSAYERPGKYGGTFENRTRLLRNGIAAAQASTGKDFCVTSRLNVYDGFPYPYGFGVKSDGGTTPDLTEGVQLVKILHEQYGVNMLNITIGNPYMNPHVNRPYDRGNYIPDEHPLEGVSRLMDCVGTIKKNNPDMLIIGSGFSYLRQFSPNLAAGAIQQGLCDMAGFGRMAFAYPQFIQDLRNEGELDPKKVCVTCGECARLLRAGECAGCVVRDAQQYKAADR